MKPDVMNRPYFFRLCILSMLSIAFCLFMHCAVQVAGGSAGETGNSYITGTIVDTSGNVEPGSYVFAIPSEYNHIQGGQSEYIVCDTTDENGKYTIKIKKKGTYNIQALHPDKMTRLLIKAIPVNTDSTTIDLFTDTLHVPGAARIALPDTVDTIYGYVYIPGSFYAERISEEELISDNNTMHLVFDSLPANTLPAIKYGRENSSMQPVSLADTVAILAGDTVNINPNLLWTVYSSPDYPIPDNMVIAVMVDNSGTKWIGTKNSGFALFDDVNWTIKNTGNSLLPHNTVSAFAQQTDDIVWVGTYGGLVRITGRTWEIFTTATSGLPNDTVVSIAVDSTDIMWFGTLGGCAEYDGQTWKAYTIDSLTFRSNHINAIAISSINTKYFGTDSGLVMYDGTMWADIDSLKSKCIKAIDIEPPNNIKWIATPAGISHSTTQGTWILLNSASSGFPNDNFLSIALDNNRAVWAGTGAEGTIVKIENSTIEIYNAQNSDALGAVGAINCIAVDIDNCIYFGTDNEGLVKLQILSGN